MENALKLKKATENKNLLAKNTYNCIKEVFSEEEKIIFSLLKLVQILWMELNYANITILM